MINEIAILAVKAVDICTEKFANVNGPVPWAFEEEYALQVIEYCAKIAEDASTKGLSAHEIADLIRKFKRLN